MKKLTVIIMLVCASAFVAGSAQAFNFGPTIPVGDPVMTTRFSPSMLQHLQQNQDYLDDQPAEPQEAPLGIEQSTSMAVTTLDCNAGITTDCKVIDELNVILPDMDCDCIAEVDRHGVAIDNCPEHANRDQMDSDGDGKGDACTDTDGDTIMDDVDNCVDIANTDQMDTDGDTIGDACEDSDNDGFLDSEDNCPLLSNTTQYDRDDDGVGDSCDNCPLVENNAQTDTDENGIGDACSNDDDGDGITDSFDNCPLRYNTDQADTDADGIGDRCDNCIIVANADQTDSNGNGVGDGCEPAASVVETNLTSTSFDHGCTMLPTGFAAGSLVGIMFLVLPLAGMALRRKK